MAVAAVVLAGCGGGTAPGALSERPAPAVTTTGTPDPSPTGDPVTVAYLRYWDAVLAAHRAADPDAAGLAAVAADPELARVRTAVGRNSVQHLSVRGVVEHRPAAPVVSGATATIEDCYDVSGWDPVDVRTGEAVEAVDAGGTGRYRARWTLRGSGNAWTVVDRKALGGC